MSNHVHLIVVPNAAQALAAALKHTHGRYASYWNASNCSSGHVWQGRFYSCPLDETHLWKALRYVELNPVRAGMVPEAREWPWSSARAHCGIGAPAAGLEMQRWRERWTAMEWGKYLADRESANENAALRQFTHTGRPLGSEEFVSTLEQVTLRSLAARKAGRPENCLRSDKQGRFIFAA